MSTNINADWIPGLVSELVLLIDSPVLLSRKDATFALVVMASDIRVGSATRCKQQSIASQIVAAAGGATDAGRD